MCTPLALAGMIGELLRFSEQYFGAKGTYRNLHMKIPASCFDDYRPTGSLSIILFECLSSKAAGSWPQLSLEPAENVRRLITTLDKIECGLKQCGSLTQPRCCISAEFSVEEISRLAGILRSKGAELVDSEDMASYVIEPGSIGTYSTRVCYQNCIREVDRHYYQGTTQPVCRIHYWFHPDSYDDWKPLSQIQNVSLKRSISTIGRRKKQWRVHRRWVYDLEAFNEYMNPDDYSLVTRLGCDAVTTGRDSKLQTVCLDETRTSSHTDYSIRSVAVAETQQHEDICLRKRRRIAEAEHIVVSTDDISVGCGTLATYPHKSVPVERVEPACSDPFPVCHCASCDSSTGTWIRRPSIQKENGQTDYSENVAIQKQSGLTKVIDKAIWFDLDLINIKERVALPSFFDGHTPSKTSQIYRQYRNYMVQAYCKRPGQYLQLSHCLKFLAGDANAIAQVHSQLEQWGLINSYLFQGNRQMHNAADCTRQPQLLCKMLYSSSHSGSTSKSLGACVGQYGHYTDQGNVASGYCASKCSSQDIHILIQTIYHKLASENYSMQNVCAIEQRDIVDLIQLTIHDPFPQEILQAQLDKLCKDNTNFDGCANQLLGQLQFLYSTLHPSLAATAATAALNRSCTANDDNTQKSQCKMNAADHRDRHHIYGNSDQKSQGPTGALLTLPNVITMSVQMRDSEERRSQLYTLEAIRLQTQKIEMKTRYLIGLHDMILQESAKIGMLCAQTESSSIIDAM